MNVWHFSAAVLCASAVIWLGACDKSAPVGQSGGAISEAGEAMQPDAGEVRELGVAEAKELIAGGEVEVMDVRTPEEFGEGHIAGAINVDVRDPDFNAAVEKLDKSKPYLVHCRSGNRSKTAIEKLKEMGFTEIYHMTEGFRAWQEEGNPVVSE